MAESVKVLFGTVHFVHCETARQGSLWDRSLRLLWERSPRLAAGPFTVEPISPSLKKLPSLAAQRSRSETVSQRSGLSAQQSESVAPRQLSGLTKAPSAFVIHQHIHHFINKHGYSSTKLDDSQ